jgi:type VI secretion system protein ImpJ
MEIGEKIVWAEGIMLSQQHFQQWDESISQQRNLAFAYQHKKQFGLCYLITNPHQLEHKIYEVQEVLALLPDGRWLYFNASSAAASLSIQVPDNCQFIHLALPRDEMVEGISGYEQTPEGRAAWMAQYKSCDDRYDPTRKKELLFAKQQPFLATEQDSLDNSSYITIEKFKLTSVERLEIDHTYIPPVMAMSASNQISNILEDLIKTFLSKIEFLKHKFAPAIDSAINKNKSLNYSFVLLTELAKITAKLENLSANRFQDPIIFYDILSEVAYLLSTLSLEDPINIEKFDRENLTSTLNVMHQSIKNSLYGLISEERSNLTLDKISDNVMHCKNILDDISRDAYLYLEVSGLQLDNENTLNNFLSNILLGSADQIQEIYAKSVSGIKLRHSVRPPSEITIKPNSEYFEVIKEGIFWQQIAHENILAVMVSPKYQNLQFNLLSVE